VEERLLRGLTEEQRVQLAELLAIVAETPGVHEELVEASLEV
jgi:hypothetical protein